MKFQITLFLFFITCIISAQDTLTLEQAIVAGLRNNYQIQIRQLESDITSNNNTWGKAGVYPTVRLNAQSLNSSEEYPGSSVPGAPAVSEVNESQTFIAGGSIDLNWVVFNGFRIRTTKAQLADLQLQSEGNAVIVIENTLQSIILAYHSALLQQKVLSVFEEVLKLSRDRYTYVQAKKQFGSAGTFDVLQAENNYLTDSATVLKQKINLRNSIRNLNLILSQSIETNYSLTSGLIEVDQDFILSDLVQKLESNNKTLRNQYIYQEVLKKNVKLNQSKLYPIISISAGIGQNRIGSGYYDYEGGSWSNQYSYDANLILTWTLSDGGNIRRAIKNAQIEEEIGELQIEQMKLTLNNQLLSGYEDYSMKRELKKVAEQGLRSAKLNLEIGEDKFRSGAITSFNYRDIQIIYLNAAVELLQAKYNLVDIYTELLRLTGGIVSEYTN